MRLVFAKELHWFNYMEKEDCLSHFHIAHRPTTHNLSFYSIGLRVMRRLLDEPALEHYFTLLIALEYKKRSPFDLFVIQRKHGGAFPVNPHYYLLFTAS